METNESAQSPAVNLGAKLRAARNLAGLSQDAVGTALGMTARAGHVYVSRLERGRIPNVSFRTVVRYLQACKAPVGRFMLELAQSGAFGAAEAESVRESVTGFTPQDSPSSSLKLKQEKREKSKLMYEKRKEREARDAEIIAGLWQEVLPAMQPLLPPGMVHFMAHYLEVVRSFYRAWKLVTRGGRSQDATPAVQLAFDRIERDAAIHLVPAGVRRMREMVFERLMRHAGVE